MNATLSESLEEKPTGAPRPGLMPGEFGELYAEHSRAIYYLALRLLSDPQKAEDATHDVFLKACRSGQLKARTDEDMAADFRV